jgi:hypothetical protein
MKKLTKIMTRHNLNGLSVIYIYSVKNTLKTTKNLWPGLGGITAVTAILLMTM